MERDVRLLRLFYLRSDVNCPSLSSDEVKERVLLPMERDIRLLRHFYLRSDVNCPSLSNDEVKERVE
jgi:hypothetical protein